MGIACNPAPTWVAHATSGASAAPAVSGACDKHVALFHAVVRKAVLPTGWQAVVHTAGLRRNAAVSAREPRIALALSQRTRSFCATPMPTAVHKHVTLILTRIKLSEMAQGAPPALIAQTRPGGVRLALAVSRARVGNAAVGSPKARKTLALACASATPAVPAARVKYVALRCAAPRSPVLAARLAVRRGASIGRYTRGRAQRRGVSARAPRSDI